MQLKSKKIVLLALGITALVCSETVFSLFNDPEGPNLLIILVLAAVLYFVSLAPYLFNSSTSLRKFVLGIFIQVLAAGCVYFSLS
jgi:hypothetical protein